MTFDKLESSGLHVENLDNSGSIEKLHQNFTTGTKQTQGFYQRVEPTVDESLARTIGIEDTAAVASLRPTIMDSTRQLLHGIEKNGFRTLGLEEIGNWKINPDFIRQNIKQQAGYAAEVISTWKENLINRVERNGLTTVRADDLPELFKKNDQFVDKVRMNANGEIVERIQTKFVGENGKEWLSKMMSKKFDKYFDGAVDKIECPKDYYDDVMRAISERRAGLERQLERVTAEGKTDIIQSIKQKIDKLNKLEQMTEKSTVSSGEAVYARMHPKAYAAKMFTAEVAKMSNAEGIKSGSLAAGITFMMSTADNISSYISGEISPIEMVTDVVEDTATAGAFGYGTVFISTTVSQAMSASSSSLISRVGSSCLPAAAVSFAVESYGDISDYAQRKIGGTELAFNLGENAAKVTGGIAGAKIGSAIGAAAGPVGSAAGGIVGGVVGFAIVSEEYKTAVEWGTKGTELLAQKANDFANSTVAAVSEVAPEKVEEVKSAFRNFAGSIDMPFSI